MMFVNIGSERNRLIYSNISIAADVGRNDYIEWKLRNDPTVANTPIKRALLGQFLLHSPCWKIFFHNDIFTFDSSIPLLPVSCFQTMSQIQLGGKAFASLTFWQFFLVTTILCSLTNWDLDENYAPKIIEQFLKQGADPSCLILVVVGDSTASLTISFRDTKTHDPYHSYDFYDSLAFSELLKAMNKCQDLRGRPYFDTSTGFSEQYFLREIVSVSNWSNRDSILGMIDGYSKH